MTVPPSQYAAAIATMDRPRELCRCLRQVMAQKPAPAQIIVIDDGALDPAEIRRWLGEHGGLLTYYRKSLPGLVASLNEAIERCTQPWLLLLDDDIYLGRNFMRELLAPWQGFPKQARVAVLGGYPVLAGRDRGHWRSRARLWVERLFLLNGYREGLFMPSSFATDFECGTHPARPFRIEHVPGGLALWRSSVLRTHRFDTVFEGYAYGCDKELGRRVTRSCEAWCIPSARALHVKSARARTPSKRLGEMKARNQFLIYRRHFSDSPFNTLCFTWAMTGHILLLAAAALSAPNSRSRWEEVAGMIRGTLLEMFSGEGRK